MEFSFKSVVLTTSLALWVLQPIQKFLSGIKGNLGTDLFFGVDALDGIDRTAIETTTATYDAQKAGDNSAFSFAMITKRDATPVPIPASLMLRLTGISGIVVRRRIAQSRNPDLST